MRLGPIIDLFDRWWSRYRSRDFSTYKEAARAGYVAGFRAGKKAWEEDFARRSRGE